MSDLLNVLFQTCSGSGAVIGWTLLTVDKTVSLSHETSTSLKSLFIQKRGLLSVANSVSKLQAVSEVKGHK